MRRVSALAVAILALALPAGAARSVIVTAQDQTLATATDCEGVQARNSTSLPVHLTSEEQRALSIVPRKTLKIHASERGGVSVRGWDRSEARLLICKCAAADTNARARAILDAVSVSVRDGEIRAHGPETSGKAVWWTHMILQLPRKTNVTIDSADGGIAVKNLAGNVFAATMNGAIALDRVSGAVEARTQNGPISLKIAASPKPSIVATSDLGGNILCYLPSCRNGGGAWTPDRKQLSLYGDGDPIRLSTAGAPIVIEQVR